MDHIERAIYDTVHNSEKGCAEIAKVLGMSHQVLINKANSQCESHKLGLLEAIAIMRVTGNHSIHRAIGLDLDLDSTPCPKLGILETALLSSKEHGDVMRVLHETLADGKLTLREKEACHKEIDEAIASLKTLQKALIQNGQQLQAV